MERMTPHIGIEPGAGLVGRFGDTVVLIPRGTPGAAGDAGQPDGAGQPAKISPWPSSSSWRPPSRPTPSCPPP